MLRKLLIMAFVRSPLSINYRPSLQLKLMSGWAKYGRQVTFLIFSFLICKFSGQIAPITPIDQI